MKTLIIIPTYNEADNISGLTADIFRLNLDLDILVVDDNSPDGTAAKVEALQKNHSHLFLLKRPSKDGLGRAYLAGFAWAKAHGYEAVVQMDADFSHSPKYLPAILTSLGKHDFVIGSRYVKDGGVINWPIIRKIISRGGSLYARLILGLKIKDLTGGFNAWRLPVLEKFNEKTINSNGYSFQIELKHTAVQAGFSWQEVPIIFEERRSGQSKLKGQIIWEAIWRVWQIKFKNFNWPIAGLLAVILAATAIAYWPALSGQFLNWDDAMQVVKNYEVTHLSFVNIGRIFSTFYVGMYQPLSSSIYAVEYFCFGSNPLAFHAFSLTIHLANILLVFWLFKTLKQSNWLALTACALFGLHPMNVEAVAWISATSTLLYSFWLLLAVIFYLKYLQSDKNNYFWLSFAAFIFSVLSKSAGIIFPLLMLLANWLEARPWRKDWLKITAALIISGLFGWLTLFGRQDAEHLVNFDGIYTWLEKIILVLYALIFYVAKFLWPTHLLSYYIYPDKSPNLPWQFFILSSLAVVIGAICVYLAYRKKINRLAIFGLGWFVINLFLVLKIIPVGDQITADRYNYLPMLGLILTAGIIVEKFFTAKLKIKKLLAAILILISLCFGWLVRRQIIIWHDSLIFFNTAITHAPNEAGLYDLRALSERDANNFDRALADLNIAIKLTPSNDMIHNDRAVILAENFGRYDEAIKEESLTIALRPRYHLFYYNRGSFKMMKNDYAGAIADISQAIDIEPHSKYFLNRGDCYFQLKQYTEAIADYNQAANLDPKLASAYFNKGLALAAVQKKDEACASIKQAAALKLPDAISYVHNLCSK